MAAHVACLVGWVGGWIALLGVSGYTENWVVWVFMPYFIYGTYRSVVQVRILSSGLGVLRVLQLYPWIIIHSAPRSLDPHPGGETDDMWIEFPPPEGNEAGGIPLVFVKHYRSLWWLKRIGGPRTKPELKAQLDTLWFAGDPRFLGVVAVPSKNGDSPRRLHFLYQPSACAPAAARRHWENATFADLERARRAGARFVEPTPSPR
jgi:hypothetical protein